jgi:hypothetical protein
MITSWITFCFLNDKFSIEKGLFHLSESDHYDDTPNAFDGSFLSSSNAS